MQVWGETGRRETGKRKSQVPAVDEGGLLNPGEVFWGAVPQKVPPGTQVESVGSSFAVAYG